MQDNPIVLGFSAGELSPWLSTRVDLTQYSRGASHLENFFVEPYGGIRRRSGTKYITDAGVNIDAVRLFPFSYSATENVMLEFYPSGLRFYVDGALLRNSTGSVYTISTPWNTADKVNNLRMVQVNDVIFVTCPDTTPYKVCRYGDLDWRCILMEFSPYPRETYLQQEASIRVSRSSLSSSVVAIETDAVADAFTSDMVNKEYVVLDCPVSARTYWTDETLTPVSYPHYSSLSDSIPAGLILYLYSETSSQYSLYTCLKYWDASMAADLVNDTPEDYPEHFFCGVPLLTNGKPYYVTGDWELRTFGEWDSSWDLRISYDDYDVSSVIYKWDWVTVHEFYQNEDETRQNWAFSGSESVPCYMMLVCNATAEESFDSSLTLELKKSDHEVTILITEVDSDHSAKGVIIGELSNIPYSFSTFKWSFGAMGAYNGYPQFVGVSQGRLWLGGMAGQPTTLMASTVDDYGNFRMTSDDDSALQLTLASDDQSRICWLSTNKQLLLGTSEGEWTLSSSDGSGLTASNAGFSRQSSVGSENKEAYSVENSIFYVQRGGKRLREISYKLESDGYTSTDTSLLAEHLFDAGVKEWAVQRGGSTHVWVLMNDGTVAVLTTNVSQQVTAWQRMSFGGDKVMHVTTLPNTDSLDDEVWFVIEREHGITIEQISDDEIYMDRHICASVSAGAISAPHLQGEELLYYADGDASNVHSMIGGDSSCQLEGDYPDGTLIHVGVELQSIMQTMPLESEMTFNSMSQFGRAKLRLLNADPNFQYKTSNTDDWECYDASVDCLDCPYTGAVRLSQIPKPAVGQGFSLSYSGVNAFNLLALSIERDYHGK